MEMTGGPGQIHNAMNKVLRVISKCWLYIGIAIVIAVLNLLLGILTLSYLHPKKAELMFGIVCFGVIIALAHFASLCYLIQRAKDDTSDPSYIDGAYAVGVITLFAISGVALSIELPSRCFSGPNEHFAAIGQGCCNSITAMAVMSWLAVVIMFVAAIMIFIAAYRAIELAKLPPPVFPTGAETPVMRWLDRNDPFLAVHERNQQNV
ncbi:hypothetical protein B0H34DRAFT_799226 [Crassisporium funariophilum]|nr:hypothetical protein B0H34DRAFT_799226 [Crassisporium funariophilum]